MTKETEWDPEVLEPFVKAGSAALWNNSLGIFNLEHPDEQVREWQAEHPTLNLVSGLPGLGGFMAGGMKAVSKIPQYGKWAKGLARAEKAIERPFLSKAASEFFLLAPVEAARQGIGYAIQENTDLEGPSLGERAQSAVLDSTLGAAFVGGLAKLASSGKRVRLPDSLKDISAKDSWQINLRKAREAYNMTEDALQRNEIEKVIWDLEGKIKTEARSNFVTPLEEGGNSLANLNGLFKGTPNVSSRMLSINPDTGFKRVSELDILISDLKADGVLPEGWLEYSQFPRIVSPKNEKAGKYVSRILDENLSSVGNGWSLGKEKEGLYVLARKTRNGEYFLIKTDDPGKFIPEQGALKRITERNAWRDPDTIYKPTGDKNNVLDRALAFSESLDGGIRAGDVKGSKMFEATRDGAKEFAKRTGLGDIADSELVGNIIDESKRLFVPTAFQFKNSPLARKIYAVAQNTLDNARRKAQEWVHGSFKMGDNSLLKTLAVGANRNNPEAWATQARAYAARNEKGTAEIMNIINQQIPFENVLADEVKRGVLGEDGIEVLRGLKAIDDGALKELFSTMGNLGIPESKMFAARKGSYGISHYWNGSLRQSVLDENGRQVWIIGGDNKKGLRKAAEGVIAEAKKEGKDWRMGEFWMKDRALDLNQEKLLSADGFALAQQFAERYSNTHPEMKRAGFFLPQAGIEGFNAPKSMEDLIETLTYSLENKYLWLGKEINERILAKDIATLGIDSPKTAVMLEDKLRVLRGEQGLFSKLVNKTADRILAPVLGTDSASKIVHSLNVASATLDLGFGNFAYAIANMLQPITTVLPQLSMLRSCPEALQWAYDGIPLISKAGKGSVAFTPSPMKIMAQSFKLMANPASEEGFKDFTEQMIRDGVLSPRFIESFVGENSGLGQTVISSAKNGDYSGMIKQLGTMLPAFSEQASRGYAATVGYKYFNSFYKAGLMTKEQVYLAAKKFTENTMFQFAASDRALLLQGPVGQAWGLFKNWTMHFIGWQMEYLNAGLKHNCWAPYMYSNLATSMLGGLGASEVGSVFERFAEWAGDDKMSNLLYDRWGDTAGSNMLLYGLPGAFGYSLQNQVNSPFTDPGEEAQRFMSFVYGSRLRALWGAAQKGIDYWQTSGENPAASKDFYNQLTRAFAPKMFYRSGQLVEDSLYSLSTGTKIVEGLSPMEQMMYKYFNLPSIRIQKGMEISNEIWRDKDKRAALTSKYSEAMANAIDSGDGRLMYRVIEHALVDGVDVPSIINGAQKRIKNSYLTPLERNTDYYGVWGTTAGVLGL